MIPYFKRFNIQIPKFHENYIFPKMRRRLVNSDDSYHGVTYHSIQNEILHLRLMNFFKDLGPSSLSYVEIKDEEIIIPHRDHDNITCCINYYFESGNARTLFYESIDENKRWALPDEIENQMYNFDNIVETCSFTAENNSLYVLNVSKIHGVFIDKTQIRKFFSWQFTDKDFNQVCYLLEKYF